MVNESGEEPAPEHPDFDYDKFKEKLNKKLAPSSVDLFKEKAKNALFEATGKREKEAKVELSEQSITFTSPEGEEFNPHEELDLGEEVSFRVIDKDERGARVSVGKREIDIPRSWLEEDRPHQGLKILHEIAHIAVAEQNPARQHIIDDIRMQQQVASRLITSPDKTLGSIIEELGALTELGYLSDLGFTDRSERIEYISQSAHKVKQLADDGLLGKYFGQLTLTEYELRIEEERKAWAVALSLYRKAKQKGIVIDNRPINEIFEMINLTLATSILPKLTHAVKRKSFRQEMGLPKKIEKKPKYIANPLQVFSEYNQALQEVSEQASKELKEALYLDEKEVKDVKITPIMQVDSRIMRKSSSFASRLFGEGQEFEIDKKTESLVRLACLAFYKYQQRWQQEVVENFQHPYHKAQKDKWGPEDMKIVGTVDVSSVAGVEGRYSIIFRTVDAGKGQRKDAIETNTVHYDERVKDLESLPVPAHRDRGNSFLFAYRRIPHEGSDYTGYQIAGERMEIIREAEKHAQEHDVPDDQKVARYLESRGYDINTVGVIWIGASGIFVGHLERKAEE